MSKLPAPKHNHLLDRLSPDDLDLLRPHLQEVRLDYLAPLCEAGHPVQHAFFPTSGVASLAKTMENGGAAEVGTTGNEGFVGLPLLLDSDHAPTGVHMQVPGHALRLPARAFLGAIERSKSLQRVLRRFVFAQYNQTCQLVACNRFHDVQQRCARWLLMAHDRMPHDDFLMTHEVLSMMLGVRRSSVTIAAGQLSEMGLIDYRRGHVTVTDRAGLEKRSCECYWSIRNEYQRLMGFAEKVYAD
ncbi:MAG TPA: Crp/Fnr family transcriptional regulator [Pseudolabrys sp.]|nr:Crp/Fnr family transcriptional regulator [Pseudolabrys sp.]